MKTAEEVIKFLEKEFEEACEMHEEAKGKSSANALTQLIRATTIKVLLDKIKA